ncbi:hypothetical protein OOK31_10320 [Streptomyces sp. NBC_00249]|uniref:hypothetical protein n=1 Tax=Streptomyces sp. NBC_00249 TaxID=2975690 RepID=UPI002252F6FA|nr:hypothetical protein [Streptomyces sp. NBC_00249]MCX5194286.1 hypothetical protein [Streptomyces sp. NBC_00249]
MRPRTTAAALLASLALVLPTAGQSLAVGHDRDHDTLGELHYRFTDSDQNVRHGTIEPSDNDTCYQLTGTRHHPAFAVENDTDSLALLFEGTNCGGQPEEILEPGDRARNLEVRSVFFKPSDEHHGRHDGRHDSDDGRNDSDDGRHDSDDDDRFDYGDGDRNRPRHAVNQQQAPQAQAGRAQDLFNRVFHPIG